MDKSLKTCRLKRKECMWVSREETKEPNLPSKLLSPNNANKERGQPVCLYGKCSGPYLKPRQAIYLSSSYSLSFLKPSVGVLPKSRVCLQPYGRDRCTYSCKMRTDSLIQQDHIFRGNAFGSFMFGWSFLSQRLHWQPKKIALRNGQASLCPVLLSFRACLCYFSPPFWFP